MTIETTNQPVFTAYSRLQSEGIQSEVDFGIYGDLPAVRKRCGMGLEHGVLELLADSLALYRSSLDREGFNIPDNLRLAIHDEDDSASLEVIDKYIPGPNVKQIISEVDYPKEFKGMAWSALVQTIILAKDMDKEIHSRVMLDAKPANFVLSGEDYKLYYVDFFPPLLRGRDGLIFPYIEQIFRRNRELMSFNYGDLRGLMTKLLALTNIENKADYEFLRKLTLDLMRGKLTPLVENYIEEQVVGDFPDMSLFYGTRPEIFLSRLRLLNC
ncbi:hypothetical protein M1563_02925 [Patescibacteria group bacterium]|nr:hypothetical protein [Patescibacteria group bacterium]